MRNRVLIAAGIILAAAAFTSSAQNAPSGAPPTVAVNGTVESWDGKTLTLKTATGNVSFTVPADAPVMTRKPGKLGDIGPNTFLGTTTVPRNGRLESIEVHVFPESMRGAGEGHYPWQGEPGSMMTNGNVTTVTNGNVASIAEGGVMKVEYKDGDKGRGVQEIHVPKDVQITFIEQVGTAALRTGQRVTGQVRENADGSASATRLNIQP